MRLSSLFLELSVLWITMAFYREILKNYYVTCTRKLKQHNDMCDEFFPVVYDHTFYKYIISLIFSAHGCEDSWFRGNDYKSESSLYFRGKNRKKYFYV